MRSWQIAIFCLSCLVAAGCRANRVVGLLERENRELEDRLYQVADLMEDCRRENARLRTRLERYEREAGGPSGLRPPAETPEREGPEVPGFPDQLRPPTIEVPDVEIPGEEFLERQKGPAPVDSPKQLPAPSGQNALELAPPAQRGAPATSDAAAGGRADNIQVAVITLNDRLTGGFDLDERIGHEGIITVIEPRDEDGNLVGAAAPVSVVLLDPSLSGEAARVARWDFTAQQIARLYRRTPLSEGIHLEMVWPDALPIHRRLHLFVRYTTDDGRMLEAERPIELDVPALEAQRSLPVRPTDPAAARNEPAPRWQRRQSAALELPAPERARTASAPREPELNAAGSPPPPSAAKRRRPLWSPDRP